MAMEFRGVTIEVFDSATDPGRITVEIDTTSVTPGQQMNVYLNDGLLFGGDPESHDFETDLTEHRRCLHCGQILKPERDKGLLVTVSTGDWWCRANPSNGGDAAPHEIASGVTRQA
jgi:hypothetical protein